jgi:hypothetical protein
MSLNIIKAKVTEILNRLNQWEQNAKKTQDFPESVEVDGAAYVRTEKNGTSKKLKIETLVNAANSGYNNQVTAIGEITVTGNDVTIPAGVMWLIANVSYQKGSDTVFNVPFAASGKNRIDIIVANTLGQIVKITGAEVTGLAVRPNIPINTVLVTEISVTSNSLTSSSLLTPNQIAAIQNANSPTALNPFATIDDLGAGLASTFTQLTDTPNSYTGQAGKVVTVNDDEDGLEFIDPTAGAIGTLQQVTENSNETNTGIVLVDEFGNKVRLEGSEEAMVLWGISGVSQYPIAIISKTGINFQNGPENLLLKAPATGSGDWLFPATISEEQVASREWASALLADKADLVGGLVPASQLPGFVDDVLEYANLAAFPATGESGKLYVALDTNKTYRWSGSTYVALDEGVALGETSSTAYRGDRGKTAYDHSQTSGNPHGTTAAQVGAYTQAQVDSELRLKMDKTAWIDISTTSTIVGFSMFAQRFIFYKIIDNYIFIDFYIEGASNSPSFTFTSPFNNTSGASKFGSCGYNVNGGSPILNPARIIISNNSNIVNISLNFAGVVYTATGTKGCAGQISFKIN